MRAIDMHVHLPTGDWVCGCVGHYADSIERYFGQRPEPTSVEEFVALYERLDLVGVLLGWDAGGKELDNAEIARICRDERAVRRVRVASTRTARTRWSGWRAFPSLGLRGLKLHPTMQAFDPGDDRFLPFFDAAAELGLVLLTHAGTSGLGAGEPGGQGLRIDLARPILLDRIAARHPGMKIVLAHVGWPWHLEAVAMALHKSNVFLDISGWKYRYLPEEVRREIPRRLRGQFLFGTDYPMFDPEACLSELDRLELPPDVASAVLRDNAAALLGL